MEKNGKNFMKKVRQRWERSLFFVGYGNAFGECANGRVCVC